MCSLAISLFCSVIADLLLPLIYKGALMKCNAPNLLLFTIIVLTLRMVINAIADAILIICDSEVLLQTNAYYNF